MMLSSGETHLIDLSEYVEPDCYLETLSESLICIRGLCVLLCFPRSDEEEEEWVVQVTEAIEAYECSITAGAAVGGRPKPRHSLY